MTFARPQEFLSLCEKLKETQPDFEAVRKQVLDLSPRMRRNPQGLIFEYLVGNAITRIAKDYGAKLLQPEDAYLFEPYKLQLWGYGCKINGAYSKTTHLEADIVLKAGSSQIWLFEAKTGKKFKLINSFPNFNAVTSNMKLEFSFANVTLREKYEAHRKGLRSRYTINRLEKSGIIMTCLPITKQELCEFVEEVTPSQLPPKEKNLAEKYLGDFYKPKKNG